MGKCLYIAEKPSVAQEFARVMGVNGTRKNGFLESNDAIVTWCVGHLVSMSYPDKYDEKLKSWRMDTLPFIPETWKYEVIDGVKEQFAIVSKLLTRSDVDTIYVCTDSGREGEYIYRLVRQLSGVTGKDERRVWIDSQTEEEIKRGVREAKPLSEYDNLSDSAYLRAKEDYLMGINFSRALTLKFGDEMKSFLHSERREVIAVGRVMTCVLGMIVRREREIRSFVPTPFYRVMGTFSKDDLNLEAEWKAAEGSKYFESPLLYKENGFKKRETAEELIRLLTEEPPFEAVVENVEKKAEKKNPPLLFNLAELQNECAKRFKISPDETLNITQSLYEKKLVTYPRTDARVLSSAIAKVIRKNIDGLTHVASVADYAKEVLQGTSYQRIGNTFYTDDKKITDHYAIIPTGQGLSALNSLKPLERNVYELICRRFLCIFYKPSVHEKVTVDIARLKEHFFASFKTLKDPGYLKVWTKKGSEKKGAVRDEKAPDKDREKDPDNENEEISDEEMLQKLAVLKKGDVMLLSKTEIKEGETTAPKRYNSGSLILAMENAGQLIEDEELRAQIKGSGIGTSATRAEIIKKLVKTNYININGKTQVVTPKLKGELIFDVVEASMPLLLEAKMTASWEKGLTMVADGEITGDAYMEKLSDFVKRRIQGVKNVQNPAGIRGKFNAVLPYYRK